MTTSIIFSIIMCVLSGVFGQNPPLDRLTLPPGFAIEVFANRSFNVRAPREMNVQFYQGATIIYLGTLNTNFKNPVALVDRNSDNKIDESYILFDAPSKANHIDSLAVHPVSGQLFMAQYQATYKCEGNVNDLVLNHFNQSSRLTCNEWFTGLPYTDPGEHCFHYMNFNLVKNSKGINELCIAYGQPCNECIDKKNTPPKSAIICYDADTAKNVLDGTIVATGIRNSYGHKFSPVNNKLWFTDNGRDNLYTTTDMPDDELNRVDYNGQYFGYPYCHSVGCGDPYVRNASCSLPITDPSLGDGGFTNNCTTNFTLATQSISPHVAVLGMRFNTGKMFPARYNGAIFLAEHGSWDRTPMIGYRLSVVLLDQSGDKIVANENFVQGWLNSSTQSVWGRVTDLDFLADGSMIVGDDQQNVIYRIWYNATNDTPQARIQYEKVKKELKNAYHDAYDKAINN